MAGLQDELLHATFDKNVTLGTQEAKLKGKFLFCWPYVWEEHTNWEIIQKLIETLKNWFQTRFSEEIVHNALQHVESSVVFSFYSCPSYWRQKAEEPAILAKLILYSKVVHVLFRVDDLAEEQAGEDHHRIFVQSVGRIINKILELEFDTIDDVRKDELYPLIAQIYEPVSFYMELLHDCAMDLKINYGVTKDLGKYFARTTANSYNMQTWCNYKDQSYLLNSYTQYNLRIFTGGINFSEEIIFLLERIYIPISVRINPFWLRIYEIAAFLILRANDIIGAEREWQEALRTGKRQDNVIFHRMETTNCSFEEAVSKSIRKHNLALKEFYDLFESFKTNQYDCLYELTEEEKQIFVKSTFCLSECIACNIQSQALMRRYNSRLEINFEKSTFSLIEQQ
ncbi:unnamed protein product [Allacma fusca]|uniref:Terpene synthase n=1 Tax=Allacma fusca TaxID=39272 RepID=A0A8J2JPC1_9HEXA|nr:unnamed protein product [Allacma fusca]